MPEGLEAEIWRSSAEGLIGRTIVDVWVDERVAPAGFSPAIIGARIGSVDRVGKVLLLGLEPEGVIGLHFGMTGRLVVDGAAPIDQLEYSSGADRPDWDRLRLWTDDDGPNRSATVESSVPALRLNDPRRLGRITLDPDLGHLGPEADSLQADDLRRRLGGRRAAIKTLLLDQSVVAGLGNLCVDEVLWEAGIAPTRPSDRLGEVEFEAIALACRERLPEMLRLGGSTMGNLSPSVRRDVEGCPRDGSPLERSIVGGRTSIWCPHHQL